MAVRLWPRSRYVRGNRQAGRRIKPSTTLRPAPMGLWDGEGHKGMALLRRKANNRKCDANRCLVRFQGWPVYIDGNAMRERAWRLEQTERIVRKRCRQAIRWDRPNKIFDGWGIEIVPGRYRSKKGLQKGRIHGEKGKGKDFWRLMRFMSENMSDSASKNLL